jgi:hypothetical protein
VTHHAPHFEIRFYDSDSAIVWEELQRGRQIRLLPVEDISSDRRILELIGLEESYLTQPPYVFLHVGLAEDPTDGIVVWALRTGPDTALIHAVSSTPVAQTIAAIALKLPVEAIFFVWQPRRFSLMRYHILRLLEKPSAVPLDVRTLLRRVSAFGEAPEVHIRSKASAEGMPLEEVRRKRFRREHF